jgi:hypothetical protein
MIYYPARFNYETHNDTLATSLAPRRLFKIFDWHAMGSATKRLSAVLDHYDLSVIFEKKSHNEYGTHDILSLIGVDPVDKVRYFPETALVLFRAFADADITKRDGHLLSVDECAQLSEKMEQKQARLVFAFNKKDEYRFDNQSQTSQYGIMENGAWIKRGHPAKPRVYPPIMHELLPRQ